MNKLRSHFPMAFGFCTRSAGLPKAGLMTTLLMAGVLVAPQAWAVTVDNYSFEMPVIGVSTSGDVNLNHGGTATSTGEQYEHSQLPSGSFEGWNLAYTSTNGADATGQHPDWGVDNPNQNQFNGANPLVSPFDGNQYFYVNLRSSSDGTAVDSATLTSDSLGTLSAGTYNLTIAVGARPQTSWRAVEYQIGLFDLTTSSPLGTLADEVMVPGDSAGNISIAGSVTTPAGFGDSQNILDLNYTLALGAADSHLGDSYAVMVNNLVYASAGSPTGSFTQSTLDNVRLTYVPEPGPMALVGLGVILFGVCGIRRRS